MDRARKRFADNVDRLVAFNPELSVMGDRDWTNACTNTYIQYMAKKLWLFEFTPHEVEQVNKAVTGYLSVLNRKASSTPVTPGNRVVRGTVTSVKQNCKTHEPCVKHWYANVRTDENNTIYTPLPVSILSVWSKEELVGVNVSFFAYVTVSSRDETFGFAHHPKLMTVIKEKSNAR